MKTDLTNSVVIVHDNAATEAPFVNEECGDTMWDEVLKENGLA